MIYQLIVNGEIRKTAYNKEYTEYLAKMLKPFVSNIEIKELKVDVQ